MLTFKAIWQIVVVVVLGFYVPPTAKVIRRRDLGLKSHPKDWRSPGLNSGPLVLWQIGRAPYQEEKNVKDCNENTVKQHIRLRIT